MWHTPEKQRWPPRHRRKRGQESRWGTSPPAGLDGCSRWPETPTSTATAAAAVHGLRTLETQHYPIYFTREPWKQQWGARETAVWRLRWGKPPTSVCWKSADLSRARLCLCLPAINEMHHAHLQSSTLPDVSVHFGDSGDYTATENIIPPYFTWAALCTVSTRQKHAFVSRCIRI